MYLIKIISIYSGLFSIVNVGWILSSYYLMMNSPAQARFFALHGFIIWCLSLLPGMVILYSRQKQAYRYLRILQNNEKLGKKNLLELMKKNNSLPMFAAGLFMIMTTFFDILVFAEYRIMGIGMIGSSGLWATNIAANCICPIIVYGLIQFITIPVSGLLRKEIKKQGIIFNAGRISVRTVLMTVFLMVAITTVAWTAMLGFTESIYLLQDEIRDSTKAYMKYAVMNMKNLDSGSDEIKRHIDSFSISGKGFAILADNKGQILYNPSGKDIFSKKWDDINSTIKEMISANGFSSIYENNHERVLCFGAVNENLRIIAGTDMIDRISGFKRFFLLLAIVVGNGVVFVGFVGFSFFSSFLVPVKKAVARLRELADGEGDLSAELDVLSDDEVGDLSGYFNDFISKLNIMVAHVFENASVLKGSSDILSGFSKKMNENSV